MSNHGDRGGPEGNSSNRPPLFNGDNYAYWKVRMTSFIQATEPECWLRILKGPVFPTTIVEGQTILKDEDDYTEGEWKANRFNAKALSLMQCALSANEFNKVGSCANAKEMWDKLKTTYEGTSLVKESKIGVLIREYELFQMKEGEDIKTFNTRLSSIVNPLKDLVKSFSDEKLVKKVLRSLSRRWEQKITSLSDCKDLSNFKFDDLIGNLLTHEMRFSDKVDDSTPRRRQELALRHSDNIESSDESGDEVENIAFLAKKMKRAFIKHGNHMKTALRKSLKSRDKFAAFQNSNSQCFGCGEKGHYKKMCPNKQNAYKASKGEWKNKQQGWKDKEKGKGKEKRNAMVVGAWGNTSSESSDDGSHRSHGLAAACLVGQGDNEYNSASDDEVIARSYSHKTCVS